MRKRRQEKIRKPIEIITKGLGNTFSNVLYKQKEKRRVILPIQSVYIRKNGSSSRAHSSATFLGRFNFGLKEQLMSFAEAFNMPTTTSFSNTTGVLVVDDLQRTDSSVLKKAREQGVLILSEDEFLYFLISDKTKISELQYKEAKEIKWKE